MSDKENVPSRSGLQALTDRAYLYLLNILQFTITSYVLYEIYNIFIPEYFSVGTISFKIAAAMVLISKLITKNHLDDSSDTKEILLWGMLGIPLKSQITKIYDLIVYDIVILVAAVILKSLEL